MSAPVLGPARSSPRARVASAVLRVGGRRYQVLAEWRPGAGVGAVGVARTAGQVHGAVSAQRSSRETGGAHSWNPVEAGQEQG